MDDPAWWPRGCDEDLVRACNCATCSKMVEALEKHRNGKSIDGENKPLDAFA